MIKVGRGSKIYPTAKILTKNRRIIIGRNCLIGDFAVVAPRNLIMHNGAQINPCAFLSGGGDIILGKRSVVGYGVILIPATDRPEGKYMCESVPEKERFLLRGTIEICEGAYIGSNAVICVSPKCPNIKIGKFSVVGALSYIDRSIPSYTIVHPKVELVMKRRVMKNIAKKT